MAKPYDIEKEFKELEPNFELLSSLYKKHQKDYIRKRLKAIKLLWCGKSRKEIIEKLDIHRTTLLNWLKVLIANGVESGLRTLACAKGLEKEGKLTKVQQKELIDILESESPNDYGYGQHIFTGKILLEIVKKKWNINLSEQTIYNILHRNGFSHQRGHRDYENADPEKQKAYAEQLKEKLQTRKPGVKRIFFDEFSITNRPTLFYGWARRNTKFQVPSDESKKRERLNGLLSVDADSGKEYIKLTKNAKTEDLVEYFHEFSMDTKNEEYHKLEIIIDNNSTHKDKMRYNLWLKNKSKPQLQNFSVEFINTPAYSPDFNLAEYIIHQLRLKLLHHLPASITLEEIKNEIYNFVKTKQLQNKKQIQNTINHILKLGSVEAIKWESINYEICRI